MFDFNDFNRDDKFYEDFVPEAQDDNEFTNCLMVITSMLKDLDYSSYLKSGHELMMKVFNMTTLEPNEKNEPALNVVMSLLSHIYAMLSLNEDPDGYFAFFDRAVIYPMINGGLDGMDG